MCIQCHKHHRCANGAENATTINNTEADALAIHPPCGSLSISPFQSPKQLHLESVAVLGRRRDDAHRAQHRQYVPVNVTVSLQFQRFDVESVGAQFETMAAQSAPRTPSPTALIAEMTEIEGWQRYVQIRTFLSSQCAFGTDSANHRIRAQTAQDKDSRRKRNDGGDGGTAREFKGVDGCTMAARVLRRGLRGWRGQR